MELVSGILMVMIQFPKPRPEEIKAFGQGFKRYSYLESQNSPPIAVWIFDFPSPHGPIDPSFDARLVEPDFLSEYLDTSTGIKNAIYFFLLDGPILKAIKALGLHPEAVSLFHETIRKQLSIPYTQVDYTANLGALFTRSTRELFEMGRIFHFPDTGKP